MTIAALVLGLAALAAPEAKAQNPDLQQKVAVIKEAMAMNKQALAQYTWQELQTISVKGEVKKVKHFQVQMGPDGKQQKTSMDPPDDSSGGRKHGIKHRIKEDYEEYGKSVAELAQSYTQSAPGKLQALYEQGNVMIGSAGAPGEDRIVIKNYVKQGDSVTIIFSKAIKAIQGIQVASFLDDPSDVVNVSVQYAQLPGGPNHVSEVLVNGVSKQLTVQMQNSNYQHM